MATPTARRARLPAPTPVPTDARLLVLLCHPALRRSRVNARLAAAAAALPGVTVHDLYEAAPDHDLDVKLEQALLRAHDVVVMQHPFYWYSSPSLLKEWQDLVLEFGWAYGPGGDALHGKTLLCAVSTGGPQEAYAPSGFNRRPVRDFLVPIEQTARLCGMAWQPPFLVQGTHRMRDEEIDAHCVAYARVLAALCAGRRPPDGPTCNADLGWTEVP